VKVESAAVEADVCKGVNLECFRIPVTDDHRPDDADVDRFVEFATKLLGDRWLHFHCEDGHGRTTTFLVL
jgi:protein-tyrosine phosphatase